jgi:hypothetical protein
MNKFLLLEMWQDGSYLEVVDFLNSTSRGEVLDFAVLLVRSCGQSELQVFSKFFS